MHHCPHCAPGNSNCYDVSFYDELHIVCHNFHWFVMVLPSGPIKCPRKNKSYYFIYSVLNWMSAPQLLCRIFLIMHALIQATSVYQVFTKRRLGFRCCKVWKGFGHEPLIQVFQGSSLLTILLKCRILNATHRQTALDVAWKDCFSWPELCPVLAWS